MNDKTGATTTPPPLTVAASLVGVQGVVLVLLAVVELVDLSPERRAMGLSTAGFFGGYGVVLVVAALGLWRTATWSRGPVLITQLIWLGLAWTLREHALLAVMVAAAALVVLAGVLHPDSVRVLASDEPEES